MQALAPALFLVMLELTVGSFLSLYFLDQRGDTSRGFVIFQGALYLVFAGLTLLAMNAFAAPALVSGFGLDTPWLNAQGPLVVLFAIVLIPWNVLLWRDHQPRTGQKPRVASGPAEAPNTLRRVRFAVGGIVCALGLAALVVDGMAYRTLASSHLNGVFVVLAFVAGGIALGGVMTAMLLGHWYLNTPTASGRPLEFATVVMLAALAAEMIFTLLVGPSTARPTVATNTVTPGTTIQVTSNGLKISTPVPTTGTSTQIGTQPPSGQKAVARVAPLSGGAFLWMEYLLGFLAPLGLGAAALILTRGRSFQSATGMLYLCVAFLFIGEIIGRALLLTPLFV